MFKKESIVESCYVAPWGLPNEEIPFHLILTEGARFESPPAHHSSCLCVPSYTAKSI